MTGLRFWLNIEIAPTKTTRSISNPKNGSKDEIKSGILYRPLVLLFTTYMQINPLTDKPQQAANLYQQVTSQLHHPPCNHARQFDHAQNPCIAGSCLVHLPMQPETPQFESVQ